MTSQRGLTLIEVLIASVILFLAIGLVSVSYNQVVLNSLKVTRLYLVASYLPIIREEIIEELRESPHKQSGNGQVYNKEYYFEWSINDKQESNSQPAPDPESGALNTGAFQLILFDIEVTVYTSIDRVLIKQYNFSHLDWRRIA